MLGLELRDEARRERVRAAARRDQRAIEHHGRVRRVHRERVATLHLGLVVAPPVAEDQRLVVARRHVERVERARQADLGERLVEAPHVQEAARVALVHARGARREPDRLAVERLGAHEVVVDQRRDRRHHHQRVRLRRIERDRVLGERARLVGATSRVARSRVDAPHHSAVAR